MVHWESNNQLRPCPGVIQKVTVFAYLDSARAWYGDGVLQQSRNSLLSNAQHSLNRESRQESGGKIDRVCDCKQLLPLHVPEMTRELLSVE